MSDKIYIVDSREKGHKSILKYFDEHNIDYITSKLEYGDYMIYKDNSVVIDRKNNLLELAHNLCGTLEHDRIRREISRAKEDNCKDFIFLISESKIKSLDDIKKWSSPHTRVRGSTLLKIMQTMKEKYGVRFIFCEKSKMGERIIELLNSDLQK